MVSAARSGRLRQQAKRANPALAWSGAERFNRLWQGVSLVVDEFTRAAYGEVVVHAILLSEFRHHAQGAVVQAANATRLGPSWTKSAVQSRCAR